MKKFISGFLDGIIPAILCVVFLMLCIVTFLTCCSAGADVNDTTEVTNISDAGDSGATIEASDASDASPPPGITCKDCYCTDGVTSWVQPGCGMATEPWEGLRSNYNYIMYSPNQDTYGTCQTLYNVSVTIDVTEDIVGSDGFGFQLNAYSPGPARAADGGTGSYSVVQQYCMIVNPNSSTIFSMVDNCGTDGNQIVKTATTLTSIPNATIPKGYKLTIQLATDGEGNVNGSTYTVQDASGNVVGSHTDVFLNLPGVTQNDLAPIVAFQLNLVDFINGQNTQLTSGSGYFTYHSDIQLQASGTYPSCVASDYITLETANSVYGEVPSVGSHTISQSFATEVE